MYFESFNTDCFAFDTNQNSTGYCHVAIFVSFIVSFIFSFVAFNWRIGLETLSCFHYSGLRVDCQNALVVSLLCLLCWKEHGFERVFFFVFPRCSSRKRNRIRNRFG